MGDFGSAAEVTPIKVELTLRVLETRCLFSNVSAVNKR
jgi:hypothetical protein